MSESETYRLFCPRRTIPAANGSMGTAPFLACESRRHFRTRLRNPLRRFRIQDEPPIASPWIVPLVIAADPWKLIENLGVLASSSLAGDAASAVSPQAQFTRNLLIRSMLSTSKVICPVLYRWAASLQVSGKTRTSVTSLNFSGWSLLTTRRRQLPRAACVRAIAWSFGWILLFSVVVGQLIV